ncbi:MAG: hypothetical protein HY681_14465 [Chloroflexi bacterium]|nr:hypothetical protein [Chloroflexota bacterium]
MPKQPNNCVSPPVPAASKRTDGFGAKRVGGLGAVLSPACALGRWAKRSPTLALIAFAIIATGAGAAVGNAMRGDIEAKVPITVYQALIVEKPQQFNFPDNRNFFGGTSDDQTKFSIAVEAFRGESLSVLVPIINRSSGDAVAEFSVILPDVPSQIEGVPGLVLSVTGSGQVDDVVKISPDSWTFTADAGLDGLAAQPDDGILLTFTIAPTSMSGYFEITGRIRTLEY